MVPPQKKKGKIAEDYEVRYMLKKLIFALFIVVLSSNCLGHGTRYEKITEKALRKSLTENCTLVVPWASWCAICLEELPELLPALNAQTKIKPLIIDFSRPYVQDKFSKLFMEKVELKYPTYRIPISPSEEVFRQIIDPEWKGALPNTVLYTCQGKKCGIKKRWTQRLTPKELPEVAALCNL